MFSTHCNIDKTDRINRTVIGLHGVFMSKNQS
jgi:hypothetical protein